jgi:hypothetical protein
MKRLFLGVLIWFCLWLPANPQSSIAAKPLEGAWLADGYGLLVEFDVAGLRTYELTSISCIPSRTGKLEENRPSGLVSTFVSGHSTMTVSRTKDPDILQLHMDGAASDIVLHRASTRPSACGRTPTNSPQENYDILWQTFAEQYPFFALHKVNWHFIDQNFRPRVTATTSPAELFQIFRDMIEPLQDTHTGLEADDIHAEYDGWRNDPNHLEESDWKKAASIIESKYVLGALQLYCKNRIQFGMLSHRIGYLRITTFYDYADEGGYVNEVRCLQHGLDAIFRNAGKLDGLVIDVRLNHGGDDPLGTEIASRLTDKKYLAYTKAARNNREMDAPIHLTPLQQTWVAPSERPGFKGKIALLIGPDTVSAGETFTMALMDREPHVFRIGLNTQGVFSDVLNRSLPNGWRFHLPNEIYFTAEGKAFDAIGVPPEVRVPFFTPTDLQTGQDKALERAIKELKH